MPEIVEDSGKAGQTMANGEMINELREIVQAERQISSKTANRLTLAALADVLDNQKKAAEERQSLKDNPMVRVGFFMEKHPQRSIVLLALLLSILVVPHLAEFWQFLWPIAAKWFELPPEIFNYLGLYII